MTPDTANLKAVAPFRPKRGPAPAGQTREDPTLEFASETGSASARPPLIIRMTRPGVALVALGVLVLAGVGTALTIRPLGAATGSLSVESDPAGAEVRIDGGVQGTTPLTLNLREGRYSLVVQRGLNSRQSDIEIKANTARSYRIEWAAVAPTQTGSQSVVSNPPGSAVIVDRASRGRTPLTIRDSAAGRREVLDKSANATYERSVQVAADATPSLVVGGASSAAPSWGYITLSAPFSVQVLENGRTVGTSEVDRIMLPPGNHELDFVAAEFGFRESSSVRILSGREAPVSLTIPRVPVNINALPWAEVFVDGIRIGDTPLANVMQTIGDHEVVFRHPQLGEKRQMARLTLREPLRISVDMRSR